MDTVLRALAEPNRRAILSLVAKRELNAGRIAANFSISRPAISQHLGVLKDAGLVSERRHGTQRLYRARPEGLLELRTYLERFWDQHLQALKRAAETEERRVRRRG